MSLELETNEVQTDHGYDQDIPLEHLRSLVRLNALVHVQTTVTDYSTHRYFAPLNMAHEYVVNDLRRDTNTSAKNTEQILG